MSRPALRGTPLVVMATTNDQWQDQRMQRWCRILAEEGWRILWIGVDRNRRVSLPDHAGLTCQRVRVRPSKGLWFYAFYNLALLRKSVAARADLYLSVDADTLPALRLASWMRGSLLWFDAHEWFTEVPELTGRPWVRAVWKGLIRLFLRKPVQCYTVGPSLAAILAREWGQPFRVLRNMPYRETESDSPTFPPEQAQEVRGLPLPASYLLYQGALNRGRGLEVLLQAVRTGLPLPLVLAGSGDLDPYLADLVGQWGLQDKVLMTGPLTPTELKSVTRTAVLGFNLLDSSAPSYYYSLANKFFDYVQAGIPQICMKFPEYEILMEEYRVGWLTESLHPETLADLIRRVVQSPTDLALARDCCRQAAATWNWQVESKTLREDLRALRS